MNKQEAIEKIKGKTEYFKVKKEYNRGFRDGLNSSIPVIREIDEPEKPVVPQFVADWYEENKGDIENSIFDYSYNWNSKDTSSFGKWFSENDNKPIQTLVNMHQFSYEVEKEKLYTAQLKSTGEFLHYDIETDKIHHFCAYGNTAKNSEAYHFTKGTLIQYNAWDNNAYDVNEVEE